MSQVKEIVDGIEVVGNIADELTTTKEEEQAIIAAVHEADMLSDSWLSKNIRPLFLVAITIAWFVLTFLDLFDGLTVSESALRVLENVWLTTVMFYFGSRGLEKWERIRQKGKVIDGRISRKESRIEMREEKQEAKLTRKERRQNK